MRLRRLTAPRKWVPARVVWNGYSVVGYLINVKYSCYTVDVDTQRLDIAALLLGGDIRGGLANAVS